MTPGYLFDLLIKEYASFSGMTGKVQIFVQRNSLEC